MSDIGLHVAIHALKLWRRVAWIYFYFGVVIPKPLFWNEFHKRKSPSKCQR